MQSKYRVVITGIKPSGIDESAVRANLVKLLKAPAERIDQLLKSLPAVIKKGIDQELGEKYVNALSRAGVLAVIKPEELELSLEPAEPSTEPARVEAPELTCPQCGVAVRLKGICPACIEKNAEARNEQAQLVGTSRGTKIAEAITDSAYVLFFQWIKGNIWKASIVFLLLPFFGSKILITSIFYAEEKHVVYQTLTSKTVCVHDPTNLKAMQTNTELDLYGLFYTDFTDEEKKRWLEKWNNTACRATYEMELGNIGEQPMTASFEFAISRFVERSKFNRVSVLSNYHNLSASNVRAQDPVASQQGGTLTLKDIYPHTLVTLRFGGWVDGVSSKVNWDEMLISVNSDDGIVEVGDPQATVFGRLLTALF